MKPDEFEKQLQRQPIRPVPGHWRAEILDAARVAEQQDERRRSPDVVPWWREWLWPCPQAWAGLAAVWMIILALNMTGSPHSSDMAKHAMPTPADASLSTQRRELARLLDKENFNEPVPVTKPAPTGPRSEGPSPSKV